MYQIDGSQTTDSFNVITKLVGDSESESSAPESPIESTPGALFDDVSSPSSSDSPSANTMPHHQNVGMLHTVSAARRTSTSSSMSVEDEHAYPPSRVFTQDSLEAPESLSTRIRNSLAQGKLYQRVFNKLKEWFKRFLSYLS